MARRRCEGNLELNFDGLTDSVTNLVGVLVLLVVLLFSVTQAETGQGLPTGPKTPPPVESAEGEKSVDKLLTQVQKIQVQVSAIETEIEDLRTKRLPALSQRVEQLAESEQPQ